MYVCNELHIDCVCTGLPWKWWDIYCALKWPCVDLEGSERKAGLEGSYIELCP